MPESTQEQQSRGATDATPNEANELGSSRETPGGDIAKLRKAVWGAAIVFLMLLTAFAAYYYLVRWKRIASADR